MANEVIIAEDGSNKKKLIVKLTEYKGTPLFDLRYYYMNEETNCLVPTGKGIALTRKNYLTIKSVIESRHERIMDWLQVKYVPQKVITHQTDITKHSDNITPDLSHKVNTDQGSGHGTSIFNVQHKGAYDEITVDVENPFIVSLLDQIEDQTTQKVVLDALGKIFAAYSRATLKFQTGKQICGDQFFDQLKFDWEQTLKRYAKEK